MTRTTKKTIAFIVGATFIAALVCFFAFATSGFKNWDAASWFDYWGKGKPAVTTTVKEPVEPNVKAASNAGLVYDSEDAEATVELKRVDSPIVEFGRDGAPVFHIECHTLNLVRQFKLEYIGFISSSVLVTETLDYVNTDEKNGYVYTDLTLEEVRHYLRDSYSPDYYVLRFTNISSDGEYFDSEPVTLTGYLPDAEHEILKISGSETKVTVPIVGGYERNEGSNGSSGSRRSVEIEVAADEKSDTAPRDSLGSNSAAFTLVDKEGIDKDYIEIDLTKLSFANNLWNVCVVRVTPYAYANYQDLAVWAVYKNYYFSIKRLETPTNIHISNGYLVWDSVFGAKGYTVFYPNLHGGSGITETSVSEPRMSLDGFPMGNYTFRIRALGNVGSQLAAEQSVSLSAYNASLNIQQLVVLNYKIENDLVSKFVPLDDKIGDYLYDVKIKNKTFGGWFYDSGYTRKVDAADKLNGDITIYARLMDVKVTERPLSWWEQNKWYVLIPCFVLVAVGAVVGGVLYAKKRKAK